MDIYCMSNYWSKDTFYKVNEFFSQPWIKLKLIYNVYLNKVWYVQINCLCALFPNLIKYVEKSQLTFFKLALVSKLHFTNLT